MNKARKAILTVEVLTLLTHAELKQLKGLVFVQLKGGDRRTIKAEKPMGTQHDCYGLVKQVQVNIVGNSDEELWDESSGHPEREDWGKPKPKAKRKARRATARRAARDTKSEAKGTSPRKPRPSEIRKRAERAAAKAEAAAATA